MLCREHHRVNADGAAVFVAKGQLRLGVRAQPLDGAVFSHFGVLLDKAVGVINRRRHQRVGLSGGVAEHQPLVAGALVVGGVAVHALGDIGRLLAQQRHHRAGVPVEDEFRAVVTDVVDNLPHNRLVINAHRRADLAGQHHAVVLDQRLAGDTDAAPRTGRRGFKHRVQNRVGNLVADFVRVPFGHRL